MEITTILLGLAIVCVAVVVLGYVAVRWIGLSDTAKQATITQLYAVAKSLHDARADGKITNEELRVIFSEVLGVIAAMREVGLDDVANEFPTVNPPADNTEGESPGKLPGNYYPSIVRISTGSLELNGGRVGPEEHEVTITRKQKLYAAITSEVSCKWTLKCYLDSSETAEQNIISGNIAINNVDQEYPIIIKSPGTNGYPLGEHSALFILYDQNGTPCDSYSMSLTVEMP